MNQNNDYYASIHRLGRTSTLIAIFLMFMVPLVTTILYGVKVDWKATLAAAMQLCIVLYRLSLRRFSRTPPSWGRVERICLL